MANIKILDELLASKIAAGEVIERPASVVKELMENSIDAGAAHISVTLAEGGRRLIKVVDDGEGITREDAPVAFVRHATSKISSEEDLEAIRTMGFRGEALASVATVARVTLRTRRPGEPSGTSVAIEGGGAPAVTDDGCAEGTSIEVKDLFYNTPARLKFMKSPAAEFTRVAEIFRKIAIINPSVGFRLVHGSSRPIETAAGSLKERLHDLFGADVSKGLIEVSAPDIKGCVGGAGAASSNTRSMYTYVNGRPVQDRAINRAVLDAYGSILDRGRFPFVVLDLKVPPESVDVNIHPAKSEVRFQNPSLIYDRVKAAVRLSLASALSGPADPAVTEGGATGREGFSGYGQAGESNRSAFSFEERTAPFGSSASSNLSGSTVPSGTARLSFHAEDGAEVKNPELLGLSATGQIWEEFLIAESRENGGEFYIIDAHGAAERAAFERLKKKFYSGEAINSQMLLLPERVETTPEERDAIIEATERLASLGFDITPFGPSPKRGGETFMIKAVPDIIASRGCSALIKELAEGLVDAGGSSALEKRIEEALQRIACHSVIRGQRRLTPEEGNALIRSLAGIDFASHCPHGRPVIKKFTRAEIESMFGR